MLYLKIKTVEQIFKVLIFQIIKHFQILSCLYNIIMNKINKILMEMILIMDQNHFNLRTQDFSAKKIIMKGFL